MQPKPRVSSAADDNGVRAWCEDTWPVIYRYIYRLVQNREEAEDLTQETYLRIVKSGVQKNGRPPLAYLTTTARNLVTDSWRRKQVGISTSSFSEGALNLPAVKEGDQHREIADLLPALSDDYHAVLRLRILEGYSRAETAARLGKTEAAIRGLQYRALVALRKLVDETAKEVATHESRY